MKLHMLIARKVLLILITLGLTLGTMTTTSLAVKQAFAKPCPMEHMGGAKKPCCPPDKCEHALMSCAAKCAASIGAILPPSAPALSLASCAEAFGLSTSKPDQHAHGPAPPIPIA
jgi:hypothetical protein